MSSRDIQSHEIAMLLAHLGDIVELMNKEIEQIDKDLKTIQRDMERIKNG